MSTDSNKAVIRRYYEEVFNAGKVELLEEIAVPEYDEHSPLPGQTNGREGLRQRVTMLLHAFQLRFTLEDIIAEGDRVVVRWSQESRHIGEFMGIPATGRTLAVSGIDIHVLSNGKMAEHWDMVDIVGLLGQLGFVPQPEPSRV